MNGFARFFAASLCSLACSLPSWAQGTDPSTPAVMKRALTLYGVWEAQASLKKGSQTVRFPYLVQFRKTADGNGLTMDESAEMPEQVKYQAGNLIGYDSHDKTLHWFVVDNLGAARDRIGKLIAPNHIQLKHESRRGAQTFAEHIDVQWVADDSIQYKQVILIDGKTEHTLEALFKRKLP